MSDITNGVNASGAIMAIGEGGGFSPLDATKETVDNSIDAGADNIVITCDDDTKTIYISDNGRGMTNRQMEGAGALYNHVKSEKNAEGEINGKFGVGVDASMIVLSGRKYPSYMFSKTEDGDEVQEMELNWPEACGSSKGLVLKAHGISGKNEKNVWEKYGHVGCESGTLLAIKCDDEVYDKLTAMNLVMELGTTYFELINGGLELSLTRIVNGEKRTDVICANDPFSTANLGDEPHIINIAVEVWENGTGIKMYCNDDIGKKNKEKNLRLFNNGGVKQYVASCTVGGNAKLVIEAPAPGAVLKGTINIKCGCPKNVNVKGRGKAKGSKKYELGGRYYARVKKIIDSVAVKEKGQGNLTLQKIVKHSRFMIDCPPSLDKVIGIKMNKSNIKERDIDKSLIDMIEAVSKAFCEGIEAMECEKKPPVRVVDPAPPQLRVVAPAPPPVRVVDPAPPQLRIVAPTPAIPLLPVVKEAVAPPTPPPQPVVRDREVIVVPPPQRVVPEEGIVVKDILFYMLKTDDMLVLYMDGEQEITRISMYGRGIELRTWLIAKLEADTVGSFLEFVCKL
jgi:hypothetical protein